MKKMALHNLRMEFFRKKSSNWTGAVAGTLSSCSPRLFESGQERLGEAGWWKLRVVTPPEGMRECLIGRLKYASTSNT